MWFLQINCTSKRHMLLVVNRRLILPIQQSLRITFHCHTSAGNVSLKSAPSHKKTSLKLSYHTTTSVLGENLYTFSFFFLTSTLQHGKHTHKNSTSPPSKLISGTTFNCTDNETKSTDHVQNVVDLSTDHAAK